MIQEVNTAFQYFVQYCIENMLYLSSPKLCVEGSHDSLFSQSTGSVHQGSVLSPLLFSLVVVPFLRKMQESKVHQ